LLGVGQRADNPTLYKLNYFVAQRKCKGNWGGNDPNTGHSTIEGGGGGAHLGGLVNPAHFWFQGFWIKGILLYFITALQPHVLAVLNSSSC